jgi:hypothetical protein
VLLSMTALSTVSVTGMAPAGISIRVPSVNTSVQPTAGSKLAVTTGDNVSSARARCRSAVTLPPSGAATSLSAA